MCHAATGTNNHALLACPQDAEISAFELQTILRRVLAKRKSPLRANPSPAPSPAAGLATSGLLCLHRHAPLPVDATPKEWLKGVYVTCFSKQQGFRGLVVTVTSRLHGSLALGPKPGHRTFRTRFLICWTVTLLLTSSMSNA